MVWAEIERCLLLTQKCGTAKGKKTWNIMYGELGNLEDGVVEKM